MATFTSVRSGYWNDPTTWDQNAVPADGDSVTIASEHTVIFNVDQSGFANGLAGLTINGTLKIPSQAEDNSIPDFVCLKVNANIAGSGSFLIGSPTYPISYPQSVKVMVNGTITVATFNVYGEQRSPLWDYLAQDAAAGATQIVLQNGLPLRAGDQIAIGRSDIVGSWTESSSARGLHTVASYDPTTKTVTLNEALTHARSGTGVRACLVILLSRQVILERFGSVAVHLVSGSGRTIKGALFQNPVRAFSTATSSVFEYTANIGGSSSYGAFYTEHNTSRQYHVGYGGISLFLNTSYADLKNIACINGGAIIENSTTSTIFQHIIAQNRILYFYNTNNPRTHHFQNITIKNANVFGYGSQAANILNIQVSNLTLVDGALFDSDNPAATNGVIDTVNWWGFLSRDYSLISSCGGNIIVRNLNASHQASGYKVYLVGKWARNIRFIQCQISNGALSNNYSDGNKFIKCTINNVVNPLVSLQRDGVTEVHDITVDTYYRPTFVNAQYIDLVHSNRILVKGLTVGGNSHPKAFEHLFPHGFVKNRWDAATPDYATFDFFLQQSSFAGQPIWLEYQVFTSDPIRVAGTISQLGTGESVKVQIFSAYKEPLYGDTPDFEQTYTTTGDISVNWTPPDARTWVVRVLAYPQQTTNPITIQNLQVAGGGEDGGGATPAGEPAFVFVG
jgi:G8 domain.